MTKENENESCLQDLKNEYLKFQKQYSLPSFQDLNEDFDIEKVAEHETDFLLREIRKQIMDKIIAYLRFVEMLLNPSNAPMFFLSLIKGLNSQDKRILERMYEKLGTLEINVIELDAKYDEKDEAKFIKNVSEEWKDISKEMIKLTEVLKRNWSQKSGKNHRDYFG